MPTERKVPLAWLTKAERAAVREGREAYARAEVVKDEDLLASLGLTPEAETGEAGPLSDV